MTNQDELLKSFLDNWPVERVQQMSINEYTNLNKSDSFCYWLEAKTQDLGSIWGGSSFKFGIYEKNQKDKNYQDLGRLSDDDFAWMSKYGDTRETAFLKIKQLILEIIDAAKQNDLDTIERIDLGDAYKWKIAFLYSNYKILNVFNKIKLFEIAKELNLEYDKSFSFANLQKLILETKDDNEGFFEFGKKVWDLTKRHPNKKYWLYSPGEQAYKWDEFFTSGVMALGWDELDDLSSYESRSDITRALHSSYGGKENKPNDTTANDEFGNSMNVGDVVIVKKGLYQLLGYGIVESDYYLDESRDDYKHCRKVNWIKKGSWPSNHTLVLKTLTEVTNFNSPADKNQKYYEYLLNIMDNKTTHSNSFLNLLKYKKQIILQGPPGTGKTRLAKEIAKELTKNKDGIVVSDYLRKGLSIPNASGNVDYCLVSDITESSVELSSDRATKKWTASFSKIKEKVGQLLRNEVPKNKGGNDPYELAVAKYIFDKYKESETTSHIKIIQFHPSYSYEDFVRGIVAESKGEKIEYKNVNKTLGLFAEEALNNYLDSKKDIKTISSEIGIKEAFEKFKDFLNDKIEESLGYLELTESVGLITTDDEDAFRYKGKNDGWLKNGNRMLFKDILQSYSDNNKERQDLKKNSAVSGLARQHASYFIRVVNLFQEFIEKENILIDSESADKKIELNNYVLIIDEINRANLSSVLGELIYALEYRDEEVESMYEVDGSRKLVLPPNLYIIGTMNTADRSVGHIDYAMRRRFAFVDVLPEELDDSKIVFYNDWFRTISELFIINYDEYKVDKKIPLKRAKTLSQEFRPEDVWIGHSYFIQKKLEDGNLEPKDFKIRIEYEIKPILLEYVKDGVLTGKVGELTVEDYIKSL